MEYIEGQSYDMKVSQVIVENFPTSLFYVLDDNNQKIRVYDFEKNRCSKVSTIKCVFKGKDEFGANVFYRDRLYLMKELYSPGHVYEFAYRSSKKENEKVIYYNLRDIFGMQQIYRGPLSEEQRKLDTKIKLFVRGIDETEVALQLEPITPLWEPEVQKGHISNELNAEFREYIQNGDDAVLKKISKQVKADMKVEMWGTLYRMAQKLGASQVTLINIRSEIILAYKEIIQKSTIPTEANPRLTHSTQKPTSEQKRLCKAFDEGKSITDLMNIFGYKRQDVVNLLIKLGKFYTR